MALAKSLLRKQGYPTSQLRLLPKFCFSSLGPKVGNKTQLSTNWFDLSRCFAALGNVAKARFLHETNTIADQAAQEHVSQTPSAVQGSCFPANTCVHVIFCVPVTNILLQASTWWCRNC